MGEFIRGQPRRKAVHDPAFAARWGRAHDFCAACGAGEYGMHTLTNHHLIGGAGGRSDEACCLLRLGWHPCHQLAEGLDVRHFQDGTSFGGATIVWTAASLAEGLLPKITLGIALSMKWRADPEEMDLGRLQELRGSKLPDAEPIPVYFLDLWRRNRPNPGT